MGVESKWDPKVGIPKTKDEFFHKFVSRDRAMSRAVQGGHLALVDLELNNRCLGACAYCFSSSHPQGEITMPTEKALSLIDELKELGIRQITWPGGDPLLHPDCFKIWTYAAERDIRNFVWTSVITITKKVAKEICREDSIRIMGIHIDTVEQEAYNKVHRDPKTLAQKIQGYRNLLDAGFPPDRVFGCICLTKPAIETIEETIDWFVDEMGVKFIDMPIFRPLGFGRERLREWEPNAEEVKRAFHYRARKLGENFLRIGPMECGRFFCQSYFIITCDGNVLCCGNIPDLVFGNVYQRSVKEIFEENRDALLFRFPIEGKCGQCENNEVCFGCRATAYHYAGDIRASDPKCWLNIEARKG